MHINIIIQKYVYEIIYSQSIVSHKHISEYYSASFYLSQILQLKLNSARPLFTRGSAKLLTAINSVDKA